MRKKKEQIVQNEIIPASMIYPDYHWARILGEYVQICIANLTNDIIQASYDGEDDHFFIQPNEFQMTFESEIIHYTFLFIKNRNKDMKLEGHVELKIIRKQ